ncbi:MAG: hypothetical protein CL908_00940 [Deltaproteobacteria bacterium]|nr:hypothetical protein [Deltaproteobacteria bacterium]
MRTLSSRVTETLGVRSGYPASLLVGIAAAELLAWSMLGRKVEVLAILALAFIWGGFLSFVALVAGRRRVGSAALCIVLATALLPYAMHATGKLDLAERTNTIAAIGLAVLGSGTLLWLGRSAVVRVTAAIGCSIGLALVLGTHRSPSERPQRAAPGDHPDVILVVMDTTRRDHVSLYGYPRPTTPAIDRLASKARVFDDAWSSAPWTPPSHASLFTGLLPAEHGVRGHRIPPFPADLPSLPELLQRAGYHTAGLVANPNLHGRGWSRGFDLYEPPWFEGPHTLTSQLNQILMKGRPAWLDQATTDRILASAQRWWRSNADAPRFLFLNFIDPHDPYHPLEVDRLRFLPELSRQDALDIEQDPQRYAVDPGVPEDARHVIEALYDAEIAGLDRRLGTFFDWLEKRGELDRSLVILTSDHGERLGERGLLGHLLQMDQHLLRVPLLLRYPPAIAPERVPARVQLHGVAGEVLATVGIEGPLRMTERRLSRMVEGAGRAALSSAASNSENAENVAVAQHGSFVWYSAQLRGRLPTFDDTAYRGHWTLVADRDHALLWSPDRGDEPGQLVALAGDPSWESNLWDALPAKRARLLAIAQGLPRYDVAEPAANEVGGEDPLDEALLERLRALGYAD